MKKRIQMIVEGNGEQSALPVLMRRLQALAGAYEIDFGKAMRWPKSQLLKIDKLERCVQVARGMENAAGILILIDSDEQCPKVDYLEMKMAAAQAAHPLHCEFVAAQCEYEAWFIAAMESLRNVRSVIPEACSHADPESVRGAKEYLESQLPSNVAYAETTDQAAFSGLFDMNSTYRKCRSFRQLVIAYTRILNSISCPLAPTWPFSQKSS